MLDNLTSIIDKVPMWAIVLVAIALVLDVIFIRKLGRALAGDISHYDCIGIALGIFFYCRHLAGTTSKMLLLIGMCVLLYFVLVWIERKVESIFMFPFGLAASFILPMNILRYDAFTQDKSLLFGSRTGILFIYGFFAGLLFIIHIIAWVDYINDYGEIGSEIHTKRIKRMQARKENKKTASSFKDDLNRLEKNRNFSSEEDRAAWRKYMVDLEKKRNTNQ